MAGAKQTMGVALAACLALVLFQVSSAATSHTVGDSSGWIIPSSNTFYSSWAAKETFKVGDFLVFNFPTGAHTVAEVTKSDYDSCASTSPITLLNNGPANLTISSAGTHYYICTIGTHCSAGQKVSITATAAASTSPPTSSPTAAPTPKSTAAPTPKSSPAAPTPSAGAPPPATAAPTPSSAAPTTATPASSPTSAAASPGPTSESPTVTPETSPTPSTGAGPSSLQSPSPGGPSSTNPNNPPTPPTAAPTSPPGSNAAVTGAGLVLPVLVIIGASFLY